MGSWVWLCAKAKMSKRCARGGGGPGQVVAYTSARIGNTLTSLLLVDTRIHRE